MLWSMPPQPTAGPTMLLTSALTFVFFDVPPAPMAAGATVFFGILF
jgi:hypothetical protein